MTDIKGPGFPTRSKIGKEPERAISLAERSARKRGFVDVETMKSFDASVRSELGLEREDAETLLKTIKTIQLTFTPEMPNYKFMYQMTLQRYASLVGAKVKEYAADEGGESFATFVEFDDPNRRTLVHINFVNPGFRVMSKEELDRKFVSAKEHYMANPIDYAALKADEENASDKYAEYAVRPDISEEDAKKFSSMSSDEAKHLRYLRDIEK